MKALDLLLKPLIQQGTLKVLDASGGTSTYGDGTGAAVTIRINDRRAPFKLLLDPEVAAGEIYMSGGLDMVESDIYGLVELVARNAWTLKHSGPFDRLNTWRRMVARRLDQYNPVGTAQRNVAHHYDLSDALFDNFLDIDRQYSCAYFMHPSDSLELAQAQKKRHLAAKLLLRPGQKLLDIGSGWGGLGLYLARAAGVDVTGITLSEEQLAVAQQRAATARLDERVHFKLCDYRNETGRYDRIVSVGMLEHVGVNHLDGFFRKVATSLTDDGVALIHAIGRSDGPGSTNKWIQRYIFPGGYCPALSEVLPAIERSGLIVTDIEILRLHYAETLKAWRERFTRNREAVKALYDERFCRMWEFYLAASEAAFRHGGMMIFQIQVARSLETVPLTRDYIYEAERTLPLETQAEGMNGVRKGVAAA
ncbi:SAM-dependent methyltransferase [Chelatococcus reniformis]|uniref:Cyclopropane-fatty-acyl-phospholipid synthase n=1 Tax=Chelatococcus reniformis TaxID=1494448 RepID=A0A916TX21_9HYPH|nr:cyclopropane-fatty-acyl-phospholipid synthase family protein [Chelatococcus reniformis]GGC46823.1 cyclopropane-fatty-acyl-phospholipid synthase [Chelatococcus reniformis]